MISFIDSITKLVVKGEKVVEPNPLYPDEGYEQFISRMIVEKKKKLNECLIYIKVLLSIFLGNVTNHV